jgi:hypothetical protein
MIEPRTEIVLPGRPIAPTLSFFREMLGMRLESIMPATTFALQNASADLQLLRVRL